MNDAPQPPPVVPVDVAERIHQTCDRFEDAWNSPTRLRLDFFLATVAEPERSWLLEELVALEVELRRAAGEQPTEAEYRQAYPGEADGKVIAAAFQRCADAESEPVRTLPEVSGNATTAALRLRSLYNAAGPLIEDYVILGILGRGGMGTVFLAEDNQLGRKVAIKTMRPELAARAENRVRFLREARAAAAIEHDNVVSIWQVGQATDGSPFIVMPFLQGETLESRLKREPVQPLGLVLQMAREIAEALAAAHARGLTHRDIKPANIWVEGDLDAKEPGKQVRRCKILDFGLAQAANEDVQLTQSGAIVGTPTYMSPEQAREQKVDHRTDLFSLGAVLYRLCAGKNPFVGNHAMAVLAALITEEPTPVRQLNPNVPESLAALIHQLLAKKPEDRPQTAIDVAKQLRAILDHPAGRAVAEAPAARAAAVDVSTSQPVVLDPKPVRKKKKEVRKKTGVWIGAGIAVGLAAIAGVLIITKANTNVKNGSVAEVKGPDGARGETNRKTVTPAPKVADPVKPSTPPGPFKNGIGMEFVKVPKGTAWLGGGGGKPGERRVEFKENFYLGKYEVTQEEWEAITGLTPSFFKRGNETDKDISDADLKRFPVEMVSWADCQLFIKKLNEREKESGWVYRLPTAAEWEYACRGGPVDQLDSTFDFYFAKPTNTLLPEQANIARPEGKGLRRTRTCKVGLYEPNLLGLHDMHGNVSEWCDDAEKSADGVSHRVDLGGGWRYGSGYCRAAHRDTRPPSHQANDLGFRLARVPSVGP